MNWWERWPDRLERELKCLTDYGWKPEVTSTEQSLNAGYYEISINYPYLDQFLPLALRFPPEYPYFMAQAYLDPSVITLERHHNPMTGQLCLLENSGRGWSLEEYFGNLVNKKLPTLLKIVNDPESDFAAEHEIQQGEPISGYYSKANQTLLLIEDIVVPEDVLNGTLTAFKLPHLGRWQFILYKIRNAKGKIVAQASEELCENFKKAQKIKGVWKRVKKPNSLDDPKKLITQVDKAAKQKLIRNKAHKECLYALLYREETEWRITNDAWCAAVIFCQNSKNKCKNTDIKAKIVSTGQYSKRDRYLRAPELESLSIKTVCIVGVGMLGGQIALQLAKAGVGKLILIDSDFVELPTTIRYALGAEYANWSKVEAFKLYIKKNYPTVSVETVCYRIGDVESSHADSKEQFLKALSHSDLIIDSAAEKLVSYYICHQLRGTDIPSLIVTTRPGSWGGDVWLSLPNNACWECFENHNQANGQLPMPNGDDSASSVQSGGCAQPTSPGNGFDADIISLNTVRQAVGYLTASEGGYPLSGWNAMVINLRGVLGEMIAPEFQPFQLDRHPSCSCSSDA